MQPGIENIEHCVAFLVWSPFSYKNKLYGMALWRKPMKSNNFCNTAEIHFEYWQKVKMGEISQIIPYFCCCWENDTCWYTVVKVTSGQWNKWGGSVPLLRAKENSNTLLLFLDSINNWYMFHHVGAKVVSRSSNPSGKMLSTQI